MAKLILKSPEEFKKLIGNNLGKSDWKWIYTADSPNPKQTDRSNGDCFPRPPPGAISASFNFSLPLMYRTCVCSEERGWERRAISISLSI